MKALLIAVIVSGSLSALAAEARYECTSQKGEIIVTTNDNGGATIDFSRHPVKEEDYFHFAYFDILKDPSVNFQHEKLIISDDLIKNEKDTYRMKFMNTPNLLIANANGGADFSTSRVEFRFNKKKLKARLTYKVSAWIVMRYVNIKDTLHCVQN